MKRQVPCEPSDDSQPSRKRGPSSRPPRASQACRSCAASKVRCDDLDICRRCLKRGVPCVRPTPVGHGHRTVVAEEPSALSDSGTRASVDRDDSCILASTIQEFAEAPPSLIAPINPVARDENSGDLTNATFAFPNSPMSLGPSGHSQVGQTIFPRLVDMLRDYSRAVTSRPPTTLLASPLLTLPSGLRMPHFMPNLTHHFFFRSRFLIYTDALKTP